MQQGEEAGEQGHEQRGVLAPAERLQPLHESPGEHARLPCALIGGHNGPWPIRRERHLGGQAGELAPPVGELTIEPAPRELAPLPRREVAVLHGERRQGRRPTGGERIVQDRELAEEHAVRPSIGGDVMGDEQQHMVEGAQADQPRPDRPARGQIERPRRRLSQRLRERGLACGVLERGQIERLEVERPRRLHNLVRLALRQREHGAQGLVPRDDLVERARQARAVELALETQGGRLVVRRRARKELIEEPEPLLGERERAALTLGPRQNSRVGRRHAMGQQPVFEPDPPLLLSQVAPLPARGKRLVAVAHPRLRSSRAPLTLRIRSSPSPSSALRMQSRSLAGAADERQASVERTSGSRVARCVEGTCDRHAIWIPCSMNHIF